MKIKVIAEAGVNHNGSLTIAKKLASKAKEIGADYVKFQIFNTEEMAIKTLKKTFYQNKNTTSKFDNQYQMLSKLSLSQKKFDQLIAYCKKIKIKFLASVFDNISLDYLRKKSNIVKIGSSEISNYFLLRIIAKYNKKLIISTGMSDFLKIKKVINLLIKNGQNKKKITLLHCNSAYPTPHSDANLLTITKLRNLFKTEVGYSDHTVGNEATYAAVALGATVIERHFTLSKKFPGPDQKISLNPSEFREMITGIRNLSKALKVKKNKHTKSEKENVNLVNKFLVAKKNIKKGEKFSLKNLTAKRTGGGIESMKIEILLHKKSNKNFKINDVIKI